MPTRHERPPLVARRGNQFQYNDRVLAKLMRLQVGTKGTGSTLALSGWWTARGAPRRFSFEITRVAPTDRAGTFDGSVVAIAMCDDGLELDCTAAFLMRSDTEVGWNTVEDARALLGSDDALTVQQATAMRRAQAIAEAYIEAKGRELGDACIVTLDGYGANRRAFQQTFARERLPCPRIVTYECDAKVALCQKILFDDVVYTAGDPTLRSKRRAGADSTQPPLLEDLVASRKLDVESVGMIYLDYCGGPPARFARRMAAEVLAAFPNLAVYAATMSKRRHPDLERTFGRFVPHLYGFRLKQTFSENARVLCKLFARCEAVPRHIAVPGCWWLNCPKELKRKRFSGVLLHEDVAPRAAKRLFTAAVRTERGLEVVKMDGAAVRAYAAAHIPTRRADLSGKILEVLM